MGLGLGLGLGIGRRLKGAGQYLLDAFSGAAAAYSLRKLEKDATYAVRVRRSTDNSELDIGFDKDDQLDTTALLDFVNVRNEYPADYDTGAAAAYSLRYVTERPDTKPADFGSGAAAAYSLRYVSDSYSGAVVRVRRSSDNAEADFTATEVSDGTLEDWVNTEYTFFSDTFDGTYTWNAVLGSASVTGGVLDFPNTSNTLTFVSLGNTIRTQQVRVTFTILNYVSGTIRFENFNNGAIGTLRSGNGTYTEILTISSSGNNNFGFAGFMQGQIDNLVIEQLTSDGLVTTWYDQSGNSNDATQSNASSQPKIVDAGTLVTENGKPAILPVDRTNFFVINPLTLTSDTWVFSTIKNPLGESTILIEGDNGNEVILTTSATSTSTVVNSNYTSVSLYKDGAAFNPTTRQDAYNELVNQSLLTANFDGSISTFINIGYPSSVFLGMFQIQEFIVYNSDQSSNRKNIEWDINDYYGIYSQWDRESVVRVRRSVDNAEADFNPTEITDGTLLAWVGNTASDNGHVTTWYDQSGNSNDATQGTAASQPKIVDAGVLVEENGKPAVSFDGSDDALIASDSDTLSFTDGSGNDKPISAFATFKITFIGVVNILFAKDSGGVNREYAWGYFTEMESRFFLKSNGGADQISRDNKNAGQLGLHQQSTMLYDASGLATGITFYSNGVVTTMGDAFSQTYTGMANTSSNFTIGYYGAFTPSYFQGKIQELILYPSDQSSNRGNIEANVNDYYSIYTSTNDGFVTTWYDQSGNGNDATQGSASSQPKIVSAGVLVTENGKPAVDFDGDFFNATITTISTFTNLSTFWVQTQELAAAPNANTQSLLLIGEGGNISNGMSFSQSTGVLSDETFCMYFRNSTLNNQGRLGSSTYSRAANTQELLTAFNLSTGTSFYSNSVQINLDLSGFITTLTDTSPSNQSLVSNVIAIGQSYSGTTPHTSQEIIFYPSDQDTNRIGIEANINKQYNIYWDGTQKGLLDTYTGAEAAYSLRALNSAYTGAILRVRRASNNAEQDIYAKWDGTLNVEALETFCAATDGYVVTWYDQSGNANNATQATAASQPQIVSSGSIITDSGYQVIQYDGSNDNLGTSFTATGTMLMGGADGGAFYEISRSGAYNLLGGALTTDHPLKESIRVIWGRTLSAGEQSAIESRVTYSDWDFSDVTNFRRYWRDRRELTSFPLINVSSGTTFQDAWRDCTSLTSFPLLNVSSVTDFFGAWNACRSLTSFPLLDVSSGTDFGFAWNNCNSLEDFPANMFDSVTATNFPNAFFNTNLTQTSIDNILVSIDTAGQSGGTFDQSGGSAPSSIGEAAIDNLRARGWTITVTGGY